MRTASQWAAILHEEEGKDLCSNLSQPFTETVNRRAVVAQASSLKRLIDWNLSTLYTVWFVSL